MNTTALNSIQDAHQELVKSYKERLLLDLFSRRALLKKLKKAILDNEEKIYAALKKDMGRSAFETYVSEIAFINEAIDNALKSLSAWCRKRHVTTPLVFQPGHAFIEPTPKGVVLILAPWNYPFQLSLVPLVSAIAAGNCVMVKPSEFAHESSLVIKDILESLDTRLVRVICGEVDVALSLLKLPFDHIFYTGSTQVGREVMKKAAEHLTPVTLELGGKSPVIIHKSCDLNLAAKRIVWGKCWNAGQTCLAPDYVLIQKDIKNDFIEHLKKHLTAMFGEDAKKSDSYGRIINEKHYTRLLGYLKEGKIVQGGKFDDAERYIEPTVLVDCDVHSKVMTEEIFGPILPLVGYDTLEEALQFVNNKPHPLALYIFATDKQAITTVLEQTLSGSVAINECVSQVGIIELPFGGVRSSGIGSYHGKYGFETFSHMRAVYKRSNHLDNPVRYAPYSEAKLRMAKILL